MLEQLLPHSEMFEYALSVGRGIEQKQDVFEESCRVCIAPRKIGGGVHCLLQVKILGIGQNCKAQDGYCQLATSYLTSKLGPIKRHIHRSSSTVIGCQWCVSRGVSQSATLHRGRHCWASCVFWRILRRLNIDLIEDLARSTGCILSRTTYECVVRMY